MDGAALAARIRQEVAAEVAGLGRLGLATVLVGDDPASADLHPARSTRRRAEAGIEPHDHHLPADTSEAELLALVEELNADDAVDGILVQLPLPGHIDESRVLRSVAPIKDVDGFHPGERRPALPRPADVRAGDAARDHGAARGVRGAAGGRARRRRRAEHDRRQAGRASLLLRANATVTICHSRTADLGLHIVRSGRAGRGGRPGGRDLARRWSSPAPS